MASLLIDMVRRGNFPAGSCRAAHNPANPKQPSGLGKTKARWLLARHSKQHRNRRRGEEAECRPGYCTRAGMTKR